MDQSEYKKGDRVEPDDPERCQHVGQNQCVHRRVEGTTVCIHHGGNLHAIHVDKVNARNYRLTKYQAQLDQKVDSAGIKSLREEIGLLRMLIEENIGSCEDTHDLLLKSGPIADLIFKVQQTVMACDKLERSMGQLVDLSAIMEFATEVVELINRVAPSHCDILANGILDLVGRLSDDT